MDLSLSISNRQIKPGVVKMFQFENETTTLQFTLDSYMHDQIDLRNYKAYVITSINGHIDMTELESNFDGEYLILTWTVQEFSLRNIGAVNYQIVFKENADDGENSAVFYSYKAILQVRESLEGDNQILADYPTLLKQWIDRINELSGTYDSEVIYMQPDAPLDVSERLAGRLYYQIEDTTTYEGHFEDHLCQRLGEFNGKYITNADMNTILAHGEYICGGTLKNMPIASTYCMVRVTDTALTNRIIQEVYVPVTNNYIRTFVRTVTGDNTFGAWNEVSSVGYVDARLHDKDFELEAITAMVDNSLSDLFIETFVDTSALNTVPSGYDSVLRKFDITGDSTLIFTAKSYTGSPTQFWINVDHEGGTVTPQISVDLGVTWITLTNNTLTDVSFNNNKFFVKLELSGSLTLKNVAFGLK